MHRSVRRRRRRNRIGFFSFIITLLVIIGRAWKLWSIFSCSVYQAMCFMFVELKKVQNKTKKRAK